MAGNAKQVNAMAGFSAVELLVTIAIMGITLAIAVPGVSRLLARQEIVLESEQLVATLNNARITSIALNRRVVLCPSSDLQSCSTAPHWHNGLLVFVDRNGNRELDADERLLKTTRASADSITITTSRSRRRITYNGTGQAPGSNVTFSICNTRGQAKPKSVIISNSGRPRRSATRPDGRGIQCAN
jgi:type IV fimbrial biogenesis protein FimT